MAAKIPPWMHTAMHYMGVKEIKGVRHNSAIQEWLAHLNAWWHDDETPWCGVYVGQCMGFYYSIPTLYMTARKWLNWGVRIKEPVYGCVVVMKFGKQYHVGFVAGRSLYNRIQVLGGNQGDAVKKSWFDEKYVIGYRLPEDYDYTTSMAVPILDPRRSPAPDSVV